MRRIARVVLVALLAAGLVGPELAAQEEAEEAQAEDEEVIEMPPECVNRTPRQTSPQYRECTGDGEAVCAVWNPPKSSQCEAELQRSEGVEVSYQYFGQSDCRSSDRSQDVKRLVIHNGDNARGNTETWKCRRGAAHYTIDRDGSIFQHIGEERVAWHASRANPDSIGIELQILRGYGSSCNSIRGKQLADAAAKKGVEQGEIIRELCEPTAEQYASLRTLIADIRTRHEIDDIVGHCEVEKPSGHADPRAFDWSEIGMSNADKQGFVEANSTACAWYHLH